MGATRHSSLLTLGLATGLSASVCAYDGMMGLTAMTPVGNRISDTNLTALDAGSLYSAGLMDMHPVAMSPALISGMTLTGTHAGLVAADTVGIGTEGVGVDSGTGTSDLWTKIKLDKNPDVVGRHIGPGRLLPDVTVDFGYNDNLTFENNESIGSYYTGVSPHLGYVLSGRTRKLALDYFLNARYFEGTGGKDDYVDNRVVASFDYNPTRRIFASAFAEYKDSHDGRGQGRAEAGAGITQTSLDEWHLWGMGGKFTYGAPTARGRLEFDAAYVNKRYDTNRLFTFTRDLDDFATAGRFFYRVRPKTSLVFEGRNTAHDYARDEVGTPSLDGMTTTFLTGVTWQATYKTTGFAKFGYNLRTFDSEQRDNQGGLSWNVGVDWKPKSYSTVHLATAQSFAETNGTGDAINQRNILASWHHYWRDRFSTRLDMGYQTSTFDPDNREDTSYLMGARADYAFRRWMNLGAGFRHSTTSSSDDEFDYEQNIFEIKVDLIF